MLRHRNELLNLIEILKEEHQEILRQIDAIESSSVADDENALIRLFDFINLVHHQKEEHILFPSLADSKCLRQGGPLCVYFMGLRLDFDPLGQMRERLKNFSQKCKIILTEKEAPLWLSPQNPLSIPMEEHEVAHLLNLAILKAFRLPDPELKEEFLKPLLRDYFNLLKQHIHKEDSCLFVQCAQSCL